MAHDLEKTKASGIWKSSTSAMLPQNSKTRHLTATLNHPKAVEKSRSHIRLFPQILHEPREKYLINGKDIRIAHEIVSVLGEDGKTMRTESVQSFARKQLLRHYQSLDDFVQTWTEAERKQAVMDELKEYAILIDAVREANPALKDADIFDVICHVAFDQPPLTRKERANNVKKRNYFGKYEGKAREVLEALLDKYAENGILDFEKANILEIPPFNSIGKPTKIIKLFGGKVAFEQAIRELEYQIYKSA